MEPERTTILQADAGAPSSSSPSPSLTGSCNGPSEAIFRALLSAPTSLANSDSHATAYVFFSLLIVLGLGLLIFGARFETLTIMLSFGTSIFTGTFVFAFAASPIAGSAAHLPSGLTCELPLMLATGVTFLLLLIMLIIRCTLAIVQPVLDFLQGFTLGTIGMVVLFVVLLQATNFSILTEKPVLYAFGGVAVVAAVVAGCLAIYFLPIMGLILRCAAGGFAFAIGVQGIYNTASPTAPLPQIAFLILIAASAGSGALYQMFCSGPSKEKKEEPAKGIPPPDEKTELLVNK